MQKRGHTQEVALRLYVRRGKTRVSPPPLGIERPRRDYLAFSNYTRKAPGECSPTLWALRVDDLYRGALPPPADSDRALLVYAPADAICTGDVRSTLGARPDVLLRRFGIGFPQLSDEIFHTLVEIFRHERAPMGSGLSSFSMRARVSPASAPQGRFCPTTDRPMRV